MSIDLLNLFELLLQNRADTHRHIFDERVPIDVNGASDDAFDVDPDPMFIMPIDKCLYVDPACVQHSCDALRIGGIESHAFEGLLYFRGEAAIPFRILNECVC